MHHISIVVVGIAVVRIVVTCVIVTMLVRTPKGNVCGRFLNWFLPLFVYVKFGFFDNCSVF